MQQTIFERSVKTAIPNTFQHTIFTRHDHLGNFKFWYSLSYLCTIYSADTASILKGLVRRTLD